MNYRHAQLSEIIGYESRADICRLASVIGAPFEQFAEPARGRPGAPMRRLEASNASTFLVDENGRSALADRVAQGIAKDADLGWCVAIAAEQDEPERLRIPEKFT